ncbi:hypothetical protein R3W88_000744 [Solanum pinnatisectum]|uniref:Leucine-rich repeat-containing N-terminal plant-type domain-containing protein n=1 Tax=Solanum pinnatisectum TaxID=50273 RepID=A0AAV9MG89_9SOLN|nr:hypothetical protein R3W88_000744 [Solanum pinnatisectum]
MFTINAYSKTLSWNMSIDCCSWDEIHCDEMTRKAIKFNLANSGLQGKFHSNSSLFQLSNLKRLNLSFNNFSGSYILPKFGEFSSLRHLDLSFKPHNFELLFKNLTQLRELNFESMNVSSTIPLNFSSYLLYTLVFHLSNLESLDLSSNSQLSVRFPTTKWNSTASLQALDIYRVNATGRIPESFGHLTSLRTLDLFSCNLSGFGKLGFLSLTNNNFDGQLEFLSFNRWTQFEWLDFSVNSLTSQIPSNVSGMQNLQSLYLSSNHLNGTITSWMFSLATLEWLDLSDNHFSGKIQEFKSKTLIEVVLKQNQLEGSIPKSLLDQQFLRFLLLSRNNLSGQIASTICNLKTLQNFEAMKINGENSGTREYVADIGSHYYTNSLIVTTKGMDVELPRVLTTNIIIDLLRNRSKGHIPSIIGYLVGLHMLNLSHNRLEGHTPAALHQLSVIESLDLSPSKISGEIPQQLASLTSLEVLNISHNHLVGCIPKGKQFDTFENSSYQGNDGVAQTMTLVELDQEGGDSSMISWQAVLMGYGCGLFIGLSIIYIVLSTQYPAWFSRMDVILEHKIITRMKRHKKRY